MFGIGFLLFVSLAFAGVLSYYGKIIGSANVLPPTFYADSTVITSPVYYKMKINEVGGGSVTFTDGERRLFVTDSLGITSWYSATWTVYVKVQASAAGALSALRIKKVSGDLTSEVTLTGCEWTGISLDAGTNSIQRSCTPGVLTFDSTDRLGLEVAGAGTVTYTIITDGSTRIEVSP